MSAAPPAISDVRPISSLRFEVGGKSFCYGDVWVLREPELRTDRLVQVCRAPRPHETEDDEKAARCVVVQFLTGTFEQKIFVPPERLHSLTGKIKARLTDQELTGYSMHMDWYDSIVGVNEAMGSVMLDTSRGRSRGVLRPGDDAWIKELKSRPELNGKHVVLNQFIEERGRWQCMPQGWHFDEDEYVGLKPTNLSFEPPTSGMDIGDGTEEDPFMGLKQAMLADGIDPSGMQTFSMTSGSQAQGDTIEECLANAQADSERIRRERKKNSSGRCFSVDHGITTANKGRAIEAIIEGRLKEFPECYKGLSKRDAKAKARKEFEEAQAMRTSAQVAEGGILMPPAWQDAVRTDGFKDWMAYIPQHLKNGSKPSSLLMHGLKYMPKDHPDRASVQDSFNRLPRAKR